MRPARRRGPDRSGPCCPGQARGRGGCLRPRRRSTHRYRYASTSARWRRSGLPCRCRFLDQAEGLGGRQGKPCDVSIVRAGVPTSRPARRRCGCWDRRVATCTYGPHTRVRLSRQQPPCCVRGGAEPVDSPDQRRAIVMKARHASGPKVRTGPFGSLLSRTSTRPGRLSATSTHAPPLFPLRVLLRHRALVRSSIADRFPN